MITLVLVLSLLGVYITPGDCIEIKVNDNGVVECAQKADK